MTMVPLIRFLPGMAMGYEYILFDAQWGRNIGRDEMTELVLEDAALNVVVFLWHNSNGSWNDAPQSPLHGMDTALARQGFADREAFNSTVFPFVRNPVAAMDYGPLVLNKHFSRDPNRGTRRRATDAFQIATAVSSSRHSFISGRFPSQHHHENQIDTSTCTDLCGVASPDCEGRGKRPGGCH